MKCGIWNKSLLSHKNVTLFIRHMCGELNNRNRGWPQDDVMYVHVCTYYVMVWDRSTAIGGMALKWVCGVWLLGTIIICSLTHNVYYNFLNTHTKSALNIETLSNNNLLWRRGQWNNYHHTQMNMSTCTLILLMCVCVCVCAHQCVCNEVVIQGLTPHLQRSVLSWIQHLSRASCPECWPGDLCSGHVTWTFRP